MVHTERTIESNQGRHEEHKFYVDRYIQTYPQIRGSRHKRSRQEANSTTTAAAEA